MSYVFYNIKYPPNVTIIDADAIPAINTNITVSGDGDILVVDEDYSHPLNNSLFLSFYLW